MGKEEQKNFNELFDDANEIESQPLHEIWKPTDEGERLVGVITEKAEGNFGLYCLIADKEGVVWQTPSHKVLQGRLATLTLGDQIGIEYDGEEETDKGNPMKLYRVYCRKTV